MLRINVKKKNLRDFSKMNFIGFVFGELTWTTQHGFNRARHQSMFSFNNELMTVTRDQLHIHSVRTFTTTISYSLLFLRK